MPHFVIHCSSDIAEKQSAEAITGAVFETAESTGLFNPKYINVRLLPFRDFKAGTNNDSFIAVFASIMEGRTDDQKKTLSHKITNKLVNMFPDVPLISMNISDIHKPSYLNREILES